MDPLLGTLLVAIFPLIGALLLYYLAKKGKVKKREWYFLLGFIFITAFYIYASAPEVVYSSYATKGDYFPVIVFGLLAMVILFVAIYFFRRHLED
jgi:lipopolysaccharide export LptBFGC system permease protein LptF